MQQGSPVLIKGHVIHIGERVFDPLEFWITPTIDREKEKIDIFVWHPLFEILEKKQRYTVLYLFLDELLGEYGTEHWIGRMELASERLTEAIPLPELLDVVNKMKAEEGWKKHPPGGCFTGYNLKEPHDRFLRGDTIAGTTANFPLIRDYLDAEGELEDPLKNSALTTCSFLSMPLFYRREINRRRVGRLKMRLRRPSSLRLADRCWAVLKQYVG